MKPEAWLTDVLTLVGGWPNRRLAELHPLGLAGRQGRRTRRRVNGYALFNQTLEPDRARELKEQMLAAGLPV
ncbi:MAG: transposase domain-containing protein [Rhodospirillales bacterium]|nr:transposase domain-containing protein [Rhodospirillales bacterium]